MSCRKKGESVVVISHPKKRDNGKYIYTVTCMHDIPPYCLDKKYVGKGKKGKKAARAAYTRAMKKWNSYGGMRTFGWFPSLKRAKQAVENNEADLHEYTYKYAVIEKTADGVHGGFELPKEYWYQWEGPHESGKYVPIEKPEELKRTVGWGIG